MITVAIIIEFLIAAVAVAPIKMPSSIKLKLLINGAIAVQTKKPMAKLISEASFVNNETSSLPKTAYPMEKTTPRPTPQMIVYRIAA